MPAKTRGRPSKCTPELTQAITDHIKRGIAFKTACIANGVAEVSGHEWMRRGETGSAKYVGFYTAITCARAEGEIFLHEHAIGGGKGSAQAAWMLERRFRDHYGPVLSKDTDKAEVTINIVGGLPTRDKPPEKPSADD